MRQALTLIFISTFLHAILAQDDLAIGQWQAHLPYTTFMDATQNDEFLFFSTEWSILAIDTILLLTATNLFILLQVLAWLNLI